MEKYMVIEVNGKIRVIQTERAELLHTFRQAIGCDYVEIVRTIVPDVCLIVDESGKVKDPPQQHNEMASRLYLGWLRGKADIAGPAVVAAEHWLNGDKDLVPLNGQELQMLRLLGYQVPADLEERRK